MLPSLTQQVLTLGIGLTNMKRHLLTIALALALSMSLANAQTITKSLQGSQDPRGPVGLDANNNAYFPNHVNFYGNLGIGPTISGSGNNGTAVGTPTDNAGTILTSGTTLTLTFGQAFGAAPACILQEQAGSTAPTYTVATTGILATTVVTAKNYSYFCPGQQ